MTPPDARPAPSGEPVLPEQSREDTDAGWGEYPEPDDERLYRDRPPHWDDFLQKPNRWRLARLTRAPPEPCPRPRAPAP